VDIAQLAGRRRGRSPARAGKRRWRPHGQTAAITAGPASEWWRGSSSLARTAAAGLARGGRRRSSTREMRTESSERDGDQEIFFISGVGPTLTSSVGLIHSKADLNPT
jgi:hypothetical protein